MNTMNDGDNGWFGTVGSKESTPCYDPSEAAAIAANVKEAETMTWGDLKRQAEGIGQ